MYYYNYQYSEVQKKFGDGLLTLKLVPSGNWSGRVMSHQLTNVKALLKKSNNTFSLETEPVTCHNNSVLMLKQGY